MAQTESATSTTNGTLREGDKVIVRGVSSGVQYGTLVSYKGTEVALTNARRLWYWYGAFTLSAVAENGIDPGKSKLAVLVKSQIVLDACEIILVSQKASKIIESTPEFRP